MNLYSSPWTNHIRKDMDIVESELEQLLPIHCYCVIFFDALVLEFEAITLTYVIVSFWVGTLLSFIGWQYRN